MEEPFDECRLIESIAKGHRSGRRIIIHGPHGDALRIHTTDRRVRRDTSAKRLRDALWEFLDPSIYEELKEIFRNE